jgi:hypothetical protein
MWNFAKARLGETSTYVGIALMLQGLDKAFNVREAAPVAEGVQAIGNAVASGDPMSVAMTVAGVAMVLTKQFAFRK